MTFTPTPGDAADMTQVQIAAEIAGLRRALDQIPPDDGFPDEDRFHHADRHGRLAALAACQRPPGGALAPFVGDAVQPWPAGVEVAHVYAFPDLPGGELEGLLPGHRAALAAAGGLVAPVPDAGLHVTVAKLPDLAAADGTRVRVVADALAAACAGVGAVEADAVATTTRFGTLIEVDGGACRGLWSAVRHALRRAGAEAAMPTDPHISTSYSRAAGPAARLSDAVGTPGLRVRIGAIALVWARQDAAVPAYTWTEHTRIPLA